LIPRFKMTSEINNKNKPNKERLSLPGYYTSNKDTYKSLKRFIDHNRKNPTNAESILWQALRNKNLRVKFRRQHSIQKFIVDYVALSIKLVIEVDGDYHNESAQRQYDEMRTTCLETLGYTELRFRNDQILQDLDGIIHTIIEVIEARLKTTSP
jgi:very-short-patch-repair endonuclease